MRREEGPHAEPYAASGTSLSGNGSGEDEVLAIRTVDLCKYTVGSGDIEDINLHLPKGAIYELVGKEFAGKTSVLYLLLGIKQPDEGQIIFYGDPSEESTAAARSSIGFFLGGGFYPYLSALDNLIYIAHMRGISRPKYEAERVLSYCEFLNIYERCGSLSPSELRHLGIAAALMGHPDILILDEPTVGMDLETVEVITRVLKTINQTENMTILITANMHSEMQADVSHIGFMSKGRLVHETTMSRLKEACRSELILQVDKAPLALWTLEQKLGIKDFTIDGEQKIHIKDLPPRPEIISEALAEENIRIDLYYPSAMSLQDYFRRILED